MGDILVFSLKSAILLTVIFSVYMLALSQIKGATLRRWTLIVIYLICLSVPFIKFQYKDTVKVSDTLQSEILPMPPDNLSPEIAESTSIYTFISIVLFLGMAFLFLHSLYGLIKMYRLSMKGQTIIYKGIKLTVLSDSKFSPFCFAGRIFLSEEDYDTLSDMVFAHEKSHIINRHFLDLILARFVIILQWWNPFAWFMLRELQIVHEFQADNKVLEEGFDRITYQYILLNKASGKNYINIGNGLGHTNLKQRLKMMNRNKSNRGAKMVVLLLLPATISGILVFSSPLVSPILASASGINIFLEQDNSITENISIQESVTPIQPQVHVEPDILLNGEAVSSELLKSIDPAMIKKIEVNKQLIDHPGGLITITLLDNVEVKEVVNQSKNNFDIIAWEDIEVVGYGTIKK